MIWMEIFHKYEKIRRFDHDEVNDIFSDKDDVIVVEEKIDGANFRFMVKNGNIIFGSRTQQLTSDDGVNAKANDLFLKTIDFVRDRLRDKDLTAYDGYIFYGEACFHHTLHYDWDRIPKFLGFDIMVDDVYAPFDVVKEIFSVLDLPFVPVIGVWKAGEIPEINDDFVPESAYVLSGASDRKAEGLVFKNYKKQMFAKYVRDVFKERNAEAFGGNPKYNRVGDTNNADLIFKYCTNARIEKIIFKMIDGGRKLELRLMDELPRLVKQDIFEEEWREIVFSRWKIDFGLIARPVAKRCLAVLQQVISNTQ